MAKSTGPRQIVCYSCGHPIEVSGRTASTSCPECYQRVVVEDITVKSYKMVMALETCGRLVIPRRKQVVVQTHVVAHDGIEVEGLLHCEKAISRGPVVLGPKAEWKGDLRAPSLEVHAGAQIEGGYFAIPEAPSVP